jgi:hypothetical protein
LIENSVTKPSTFKDKLNASKIVALIGTISLFLYSIFIVIDGIYTPLNFATTHSILIYLLQAGLGVVYFLFACFLFLVLDLIKIGKTRYEYFWFFPLLVGVLVFYGTFTVSTDVFIFDVNTEMFYFNPLGWILSYIYTLPSPLLIIAAFLELLRKFRKEVEIPKILSLIGVSITFIEVINVIYRSIVFSFFDYTNEVIMAIIALIFALILLLVISKIDIKIPFNWWVVLIIGVVIFWTSVLAGVVIIAVVILILLKRILKENNRRALESEERMPFIEKRELRVKKKKLLSTREGKLEWIKTQYYDLNRTIQDIAEDLSESMVTVRKFLDEIKNQKNE